jgi:hypothetical protein
VAESSLVVRIGADFSGLDKGIQEATKSVSSFGDILKGSFLGALGANIASSAFSAFTGSVSEAFHALQEVDKLAGQTAAVIKSTGGAAGVTAEQISTLADSLERKTGVEAEAIQRGQNLLLTFTNIRNEAGAGNDIFNQTTAIMTDLGVAMGTDASGAAIQLGKALNDPTAGITALTRVGVSFTDAQKAQIKALQESGDIMGAQKIILAELRKEFGGSAEAVGKTFAGAMDRARNALGSITEAMLTPAVPVFTAALHKAADAAYAVSDAIVSGNLPRLINEAFGPGPKALVIGIAGALSITLVGAMRNVGAQAITMAATYGRSLATMAAANAPLLGAIAAISFAAYPFIKNWDAVAWLFSAIWDRMRNAAADALNRLGNYSANVWQIISGHFLGAYRSFVATFIGPVSRAFNALFSALPASVRDALGGLSFSMPSFDILPAGVQTAFKKVGDIAKSGLGYVSVLGKTAVDNFKSTWGDLPGFIKGVMNSFSASTVDASKTATAAVTKAGDAAMKAGKAAADGHDKAAKAATGHAKAVKQLVSDFGSMAKPLFDTILSLGALKNALQDQIKWKKIEEDVKAYTKAQADLDKIVTETVDKISDLDQQAKYWGDTSASVTDKQNILKEAINRLLADGVDPSNERIAELRRRYDELNTAQATSASKSIEFKDALGEVGNAVSGLSGIMAGMGVKEGPVAGFIDGIGKALGIIGDVEKVSNATDKLGKLSEGFNLVAAGAGLAKLGVVGMAIAVVAGMATITDVLQKSLGGWMGLFDLVTLSFQAMGWTLAFIGENIINGTIWAIGNAWNALVNGMKQGINFIIRGINHVIYGMNAIGGNLKFLDYLDMGEFTAPTINITSGIVDAMGSTLNRMLDRIKNANSGQQTIEDELKKTTEALRENTVAVEESGTKTKEIKFDENYRGMIDAANAIVQRGIDLGDQAMVDRGKAEYQKYYAMATGQGEFENIRNSKYSLTSTGEQPPVQVVINGSFTGEYTREAARNMGRMIVEECGLAGVALR